MFCGPVSLHSTLSIVHSLSTYGWLKEGLHLAFCWSRKMHGGIFSLFGTANRKHQVHPSIQPSEDLDIGMLVSAGVFPDSFPVDNTKFKSERVARCALRATKESKGLLV